MTDTHPCYPPEVIAVMEQGMQAFGDAFLAVTYAHTSLDATKAIFDMPTSRLIEAMRFYAFVTDMDLFGSLMIAARGKLNINPSIEFVGHPSKLLDLIEMLNDADPAAR